jgi:hypothetical protein
MWWCSGADPGFQVRGGALKKVAPSRGRREHCCIVFNDPRFLVIVRFVDIGGIVDHHCLSFLFIAKLTEGKG